MRLLFLSFICLTVLFTSCGGSKEVVSVVGEEFTEISGIDSIEINYFPDIPENIKTKVFPAQKNGKEGWMNALGEWIIPPMYDKSSFKQWSEGTISCQKNGKYGVINYKNEVIIPFVHEYRPGDCSQGLIEVSTTEGRAYFNKSGKQVCEFMKYLPEFTHGVAILRSNSERLASYPRIDLKDVERYTSIYTTDFVVINTDFDTLLNFKKVPFLLEFGSLSNDRRTFFLYPYMGKHGDVGISYGQYGYLNGEGEIVITPEFRASDVFIRTTGGSVREPNCPYSSNRSMVRVGEAYHFIDLHGNKVFDIDEGSRKVHDVSFFNEYGIAGYRSFGEKPHSSMIHLIDTMGNILYESYELDAAMTWGGALENMPRNTFIPIRNQKEQKQSFYTPDFKFVCSFPLSDSTHKYRILGGRFEYEKMVHKDNFAIGMQRTPKVHLKPNKSRKRIVNSSGQGLSSWFDPKSVLSVNFGYFSYLDTTTTTSSLYDFSKNKLFSCDSCNIYHGVGMPQIGVSRVFHANGKVQYVNYKGTVLSDLFDTVTEKVQDLEDQIKFYDTKLDVKISFEEKEVIGLFRNSEMYKRIIKR